MPTAVPTAAPSPAPTQAPPLQTVAGCTYIGTKPTQAVYDSFLIDCPGTAGGHRRRQTTTEVFDECPGGTSNCQIQKCYGIQDAASKLESDNPTNCLENCIDETAGAAFTYSLATSGGNRRKRVCHCFSSAISSGDLQSGIDAEMWFTYSCGNATASPTPYPTRGPTTE